MIVMESEKEHLVIFDTTLRDGEQSPGASMSLQEKLLIAHALERLRVDVMEAGFPIASIGDFEAVHAIASAIKDCTVCGLARAIPGDIERAAQAIAPANSGRIHTFIATSPIHMREKLKLEPDQVVEQAVASVRLARQHTDDVEFSAEDGGRSDLDFLCRVIEAVIAVGARTINIPDTVGYTLPHQYAEMISRVMEKVPNAHQAVFSVHCHNDLGMGVANSLAGVLAGARQVECTINGLGERAGNAALEEIVMAVRTRHDIFPCKTRITTQELVPCSRLVANIIGFPVQPNKAIVGANAFAHESGIHQDGVLKNRETYEIMRAQDVGWESNQLVLGKHSGRNALRNRLLELGVELDDQTTNELFKAFKQLADKKHELYDEDLLALVSEYAGGKTPEKLQLVNLHVCSDTMQLPLATVALKLNDQIIHGQASGSGVVDAIFKAIEQVSNSGSMLGLYSVNNITQGTDAQGEVTVRLSRNGRIANGHGTDTDIVIASAKAYIDALNKLDRSGSAHTHPQLGAL